jgi:membrane protein YdbS with pleckstrin-like domain
MFALFCVVLVLLILALPIWPFNKKWDYRPAGVLAILAIILLFFIIRSVEYFEFSTDKEETSIKIERKASNNNNDDDK